MFNVFIIGFNVFNIYGMRWVTATKDCGVEARGRKMMEVWLKIMPLEAQTTSRGSLTNSAGALDKALLFEVL